MFNLFIFIFDKPNSEDKMIEQIKKIRILNVIFDTEILGHEIPAFRGAIVNKVGTKDTLLFHNHTGNNEFNYKYPLIQYKQISKKPAIVCIDQGVDEIHKFFENKNWDLDISGRTLSMKIDKLNMNQFTMQVWNKHFQYNIHHWIALNQENFPKFQAIDNLTDRILFLENTLKANILSFAKGIEWAVDKQIEVKIQDLNQMRPVNLKGKKVTGFDVQFTSNVFLPNFIGLGKSVSLGYGVVRAIKNYEL